MASGKNGVPAPAKCFDGEIFPENSESLAAVVGHGRRDCEPYAYENCFSTAVSDSLNSRTVVSA